MDVLTDVLETMRLSAAHLGRLELTAPWGLSVEPQGEAAFQLILEGEALLELEGSKDDPIRVTAGDLFAVLNGNKFTLRDAAGSVVTPLEHLLGARQKGTEPSAIFAGGGGARCTLVCGTFSFAHRLDNPLIAALPPLLLIRASSVASVAWLEQTLDFIASESRSERPGASIVVGRLAEVLFVHLVRGHLVATAPAPTGWLGALAEPQVGGAVRLIHEHPEENWTVASLAGRVGMSRSAFALRFCKVVGEPPLHYLTRWRMQKAAVMLREGRSTLAEIALKVGYESEAAFSKAFKRWQGAAPGAYRRAARAA